jgi:hypothetical protein
MGTSSGSPTARAFTYDPRIRSFARYFRTEALDELLRRLEFGLPKGALKLIDLPVALSRGQYLGLFAVAASTVDAVYALDIVCLSALNFRTA